MGDVVPALSIYLPSGVVWEWEWVAEQLRVVPSCLSDVNVLARIVYNVGVCRGLDNLFSAVLGPGYDVS